MLHDTREILDKNPFVVNWGLVCRICIQPLDTIILFWSSRVRLHTVSENFDNYILTVAML